jgi:hypothetical protein
VPSVGGAISLQGAVMYRTDWLREACSSGVSASISQLIATHDCCVAEYRCDKTGMAHSFAMRRTRHEDGVRRVSADTREARVLPFHHNAPQAFAAAARELGRNRWNWDSIRTMLQAMRMAPFALLKTTVSRGMTVFLRCLPRWMGGFFGASWSPAPGTVRFGDFARTRPISPVDGFDRGKPIDRYYIEHALAEFSDLVRGRVLEVHNAGYTRMFGGKKVVCSEVLDINPLNQAATVVGDLGVAGSLPEEAFDCIIVTQTLQFIYHLDIAMENLYRALAPNGSLLVTVPGISPIGQDQTQSWYWEFTELSLKTLLIERFGETNVRVQSYGNVFAAICFLTGLSLAEVEVEKLHYSDERYPVVVVACARKAPKVD